MKKIALNINKNFLIHATFGFFYYLFAINLVLNENSKFYWLFAYFIFFIPVIYILIMMLLPKKEVFHETIANEESSKEEPSLTPEKTATEELIDKEFSLEEPKEDLVDTKNNFIAIMSHEIRTIMTGIVGIPEMLLEKKVSKKEKDELIELLSQSSISLMDLLNEMLDFSKIESGKIEINDHNFNLHESILNKTKFYSNIAEGKGLKINFNSEIENNFYNGDEQKISQMVSNLISNSIKFTENGEINVNIKETEYDKENNISNLQISVSDTGVGISAENLKTIFEPYEQIKIKKQLNGTGLGLAILKYYANLMGGDSWATSEKEKGTEVFFNIKLIKEESSLAPITTNPNNPDEQVSAEEAEMMAAMMGEIKEEAPSENNEEIIELKTGGYVLIAEDNLANQKFLEILLSKLKVKFKFVSNGQEAFDAFTQDYCYDIVLMDTSLPIVNGIESTKLIRGWEKQHEKKEIPIIAISANTSKTHEIECFDSGMNGFIQKPLQISTIKKSLSKYILLN